MDVPVKMGAFLCALVLIGTAVFLQIKREKPAWQLIGLLMLAGLLLRLLTAADPFLHEWDERYHALVAKHLMDNPLVPKLYLETPLEYNTSNWAGNHIWLHKQPLPLWCMAFSMHVFGVNEWALRLPSVLISTWAIGCTYLIGLWLFSRQIGFWAAFFHTVNGLVIEITAGRVATDHIDVFFLFFIELAMLLAVREMKKADRTGRVTLLNPLLMGIAVGAAILCKWLPALIVLPVFWLLNRRNKGVLQKSLIALLAATAVALPWQVYAAQHFPAEYWLEQQFNTRHITEVLEGHAGNWLYHIDKARIIWNELIYLPLLWLLWQMWRGKPDRRLLALAVWIFVPYLFFSFVKTKMAGYVLFTGPAVFILEALFLEQSGFEKWKKLKTVLWAAFAVLALRYCLERVKPLRSGEPEKNLREKITALRNLESGSEKTVIMNMPRSIETMFYTGLLAYERPPAQEEVQRLLDGGYRIFVVDTPGLPSFLQTERRVKMIDF